MKWRDADGRTIEVIRMSKTRNHQDGEWFRARHRNGMHLCQVRTVAELEQHGIKLSTLEEVVNPNQRSAPHRPAAGGDGG